MSEAPSLPRKTQACQFVLLSHPVAHTPLKKRTCSSFQVSITDRTNCESLSSRREPVDVFTQVSKEPSSTRKQTLQSFQSCQEWFSLFLPGAVQALAGNLLRPQRTDAKEQEQWQQNPVQRNSSLWIVPTSHQTQNTSKLSKCLSSASICRCVAVLWLYGPSLAEQLPINSPFPFALVHSPEFHIQ